METKVCTGCQKEKPKTLFYARNDRPIGVSAKCKECLNVIGRPRRTRWYRDNRETSISNAWAQSLFKKYGLTKEGYLDLLEKQGGMCAICNRHPEVVKNRYNFCVDHNHVTGTVRGLLCMSCNAGIGNLQDDITVLRQAITYLETHDG